MCHLRQYRIQTLRSSRPLDKRGSGLPPPQIFLALRASVWSQDKKWGWGGSPGSAAVSEKSTGRSGALVSPRTIAAAKGLGPYIVLTDFSSFKVKQIEPCTSLLGASGTVSQTTSRHLELP